MIHTDVKGCLIKHWSKCWTISAIVMALCGNAEALSHCSCCHCARQDNNSILNACVLNCTLVTPLIYVFIWSLSALSVTFWDPPGQTNEARAAVDSPANDTRQRDKTKWHTGGKVLRDSYDKAVSNTPSSLSCLPGVPPFALVQRWAYTLHLC